MARALPQLVLGAIHKILGLHSSEMKLGLCYCSMQLFLEVTLQQLTQVRV